MGNLAQYFCEKNVLEEELSILKRDNQSDVDEKEEEIQVATRNAYLYAGGMSLFGFALAITHAWTYYGSNVLGMKHRILLTTAIYDKVGTKSVI